MSKLNTIGVDLAKNIIQISLVSAHGKELQNKALTRKKFAEFLGKQKAALVAFEACATAHYWARLAQRYGHQVKIIPAKAVAPFRQGHKTDENDALAVAEAANRPNVKEAPLKSIEQQGLQSIQRSRELLVGDRTALSNHIRGLLMEFGITYVISTKNFRCIPAPRLLQKGLLKSLLTLKKIKFFGKPHDNVVLFPNILINLVSS